MDIYDTDREANNPIHISCSTGSFEAVDYFLSIGADFNWKNIHNENSILLTIKYKLD